MMVNTEPIGCKINEYPGIVGIPDYGVCDWPNQFYEKYGKILQASGRMLLIQFTFVSRDDNSGWRWHKNGVYIGDKKPQCEYLSDESDIDHVVMFHVHEVIQELGHMTWKREVAP